MIPPRLVLATGNAGKLREMRDILAPWHVDVLALREFTLGSADEIGTTFVENALIKARFAAGAAGLPAIADDSGLEVDVLGGAPGVHSARYAGPAADDVANNHKLLGALRDVPENRRCARYRCAMAFVRVADDPVPLIAEASWEGAIGMFERGAAGFGYDPLFRLVDGRSAGELPAAHKNAVSHRGQALRQLVAMLAAETR
jgi:XTP/dITP diphosphohydrolase